MPSPIERFEAEVEYIPQLQIFRIEIPYSDWATLMRRGYHRAEVVPLDDRALSNRQRRSCYAMIGAIAEYMGDEKMEVKEFMKMQFITSEMYETADKMFSLRNAPMSLVAAFQSYLARFIIRHNIPTRKPLRGFVDDVNDYVYSCLVHKRCAICGKRSDLHHVDSVGSHGYRDQIIHEGLRALPLCRVHHTECETIGDSEFCKKYILAPVKIDKYICKIYGLTNDGEENERCKNEG